VRWQQRHMEQFAVSDYFALDHPGQLCFGGSELAEQFTKIISESLQGVLQHNYVSHGELAGFIHSSIQGRPWDGTMWTRDAGTILRELVCFGYFGHAALASKYLIEHCGINAQGYYTFPMYLKPAEIASGDELDGTFSILIAFALLYPRLQAMGSAVADATAEQIMAFLSAERSPLRYVIQSVQNAGLLAGAGEFGGGMGTEGNWINSVQNALAVYTLRGCAPILDESLAKRCRETADRLETELATHLVKDGEFIWCISQKDLQPYEEVLNTRENKGFAGINGIGAMSCDVPDPAPAWLMETAAKTYAGLLEHPIRKAQFEKYGIYTQFDLLFGGFLSSPSYGQGYALQLALLLGKQSDVARMFAYFVNATVNPPEAYPLTRTNPYWTYERFFTPDFFAQSQPEQPCDEGCGALNIVNVAEPLKVARLLAGVEHAPTAPRWIDGVEWVKLQNWPVLENGKLHFVDQEYRPVSMSI